MTVFVACSDIRNARLGHQPGVLLSTRMKPATGRAIRHELTES
ncbi:hypothetical protein LX15_000557 [Streptoalloteichus tenebrarius]|uniref:Transposase n=1 Tax=Streptoalloteichus tenebrarius (strain ATCC 17920 / DSM 40477 / JCM 4838 / CBS 697.72 / NBRC 16177 / NCIMB 11028 / NRRL B-12390 / A12253. 1 / ISP 5477) TaxID=1933 RepID=A0ABT1HMZ3_STRSD|nr:hypothetical protein [Streptoalloteichus tenebrarius]